jgi:hypothetical protein
LSLIKPESSKVRGDGWQGAKRKEAE